MSVLDLTAMIDLRNDLAPPLVPPLDFRKGSYLRTVLVDDPSEMIDQARRTLKAINYDTMIGIGLSGTLAVPTLGRALGKNWAVARKSETRTHSMYTVEGVVGRRWIAVDDCIASGRTLDNLVKTVTAAVARQGGTSFYVGAYLYCPTTWVEYNAADLRSRGRESTVDEEAFIGEIGTAMADLVQRIGRLTGEPRQPLLAEVLREVRVLAEALRDPQRAPAAAERLMGALYPETEPPREFWTTEAGHAVTAAIGYHLPEVPYVTAAAILGVSRQRVYQLCEAGVLERVPGKDAVTSASLHVQVTVTGGARRRQ